jgi:hypothetical protein
LIEAGWHFYDPLFEDIVHIVTTSFSFDTAKPRLREEVEEEEREKEEEKKKERKNIRHRS